MNKKIVDGKVGVILSYGYGLGFSTYNDGIKDLEFEPTLIEMITAKRSENEIAKYLEETYPDEQWDYVDIEELAVEWLDWGTKFIIESNDGAEYLVLEENMKWKVA